MYNFEEPIYFWLLWIIPIIILGYTLVFFWQKRKQRQFADDSFFKKLVPEQSAFKRWVKVVFLALALGLFALALVNPKIGSKLETVKRKGVDIVFALDVSKSMLAEDIAPNRLEKSKRIISEIINRLAGDRVGLIGYAGSAFPQVPITSDYSSTKNFLNSMNTDMVSSQGTAIADAIELGLTYYDDQEQTKRVMVILSDGEDHGSNVENQLAQAREKGVEIYTIATGTKNGGPIPVEKSRYEVTYKKDRQGKVVITKADLSTLSNIAEGTNGKLINGKSTKKIVDEFISILQDMEKTEFESKQYADYQSQYQWFLGFGILLLIIDMLLFEKKTLWLRKLNLFNEKKDDEV